jgi:type VI secretion system secreted protein Hcp
VHHPVRVIKRIDRASPKLYQALCQGERFKNVTFRWYRTKAGAGKQEHYFTTVLEDAILVNMKEWFPITVDKEKDTYSHFEDLSFTYRRILWTWEIDGIEAQDDWQIQ